MAERIDVRIYVRRDGKVRAYAERKVVADIPPGSGDWPAEFMNRSEEPKFVDYPNVGAVLFEMLLAITAERVKDDDRSDRDPSDSGPAPALPS